MDIALFEYLDSSCRDSFRLPRSRVEAERLDKRAVRFTRKMIELQRPQIALAAYNERGLGDIQPLRPGQPLHAAVARDVARITIEYVLKRAA
jgi:hypothetical protein